MSKSVINNAEFLRALYKLKPTYRKALLKSADYDSVRCICECVHNILCGKVSLSKKQLSSLSRHKKVLRKIVKKGENWKKKKQILNQSGGGFLSFILAPLSSGVLSSLIKS